jgi:hypothetical protein
MDILSKENEYILEYAKCTKRKNMLLEKTVVQLKDPENLKKYAEQHRENNEVLSKDRDEPVLNIVSEIPFTPPVNDM